MTTDWQGYGLFFNLWFLLGFPAIALLGGWFGLPRRNPTAFQARLYRENLWRFLFIVFCCAFAVVSLASDALLLLGHHVYSTIDRYVIATGFTELFLIFAWQASRGAKESGDHR